VSPDFSKSDQRSYVPPDLPVRPIDTNDSYELAEVFRLYRSQSGTLGFLPRGAFEEFARDGRILVAIRDRRLLGYLAYRVSGHDSVVVHLCVRDEDRRQGVASTLINELICESADVRSIRLSCRAEYAANALWPRFGFTCIDERPGRGSDGGRLFTWARHMTGGAPPLLKLAWERERQNRKTVVLDANVFFDLDDRSECAEESRSLLADWLESAIVLCVTAECRNEIARQSDEEKRRRAQQRLAAFQMLEATPAEVDTVTSNLERCLPPCGTASDESDRRQLAHSIASGADFFVTRDALLLDHSDAIRRSASICVIRPCELVVQLHSESLPSAYAPARLAGTRISVRRATQESDFLPFQRFGCGESKAAWVARFRQVLSNPTRFDARLVQTDDDRPRVLCCLDGEQGGVTRIVALRALSHALTPTIVRRVLGDVLENAQKARVAYVECDDAGDPIVDAALGDVGFVQAGDRLVKATSQAVVAYAGVREQMQACFRRSDLPIPNEAAELEFRYWPLKVLKAGIKSYIVPIKPHWASGLFDTRLASLDLFGVDIRPALALENVYFSGSAVRLPRGARVLWYVSGTRSSAIREVRACSLCLGTESGTPPELYRRFSRLGVYRWADVVGTAAGDLARRIHAYRFACTEQFQQPIPWKRLQEILTLALGHGNPCAGPVLIPEAVFSDIYSEGLDIHG